MVKKTEPTDYRTPTNYGLSSDRLIIKEGARGLEITVLHDRSWGSILFTGFWLLGWTIGEILAAAALILLPFSARPDKWMGLFFVFGWLCAWTAGGYFVWRRFLWELAGKEKILIDGTRLIVEHKVPIFRRLKEFFHAGIRNVRLHQPDYSQSAWAGSREQSGPLRRFSFSGQIAFDYRNKRYTVGTGLKTNDGNTLLRLLRERLPESCFDTSLPPESLDPSALALKGRFIGHRVKFMHTPAGVQCTVKPLRNWGIMLFIGGWLIGWTAAVYSMVQEALHKEGGYGFLAPLIFSVAFLGWFVAFFSLLWQLAGREIILIESNLLILKKSIFGLGIARKFELVKIRNLRAKPLKNSKTVTVRKRSSASWQKREGEIAFDYELRTHRFGKDLEQPVARRICDLLAQYLP